MRMSKFSIELLLGVSVKISHQQIGSISTLLFECLVFLFRSPNIQIAFFFFQTMTFAFGFIMLCQSEFRSSRSYSLDLFGTVLLTVISFGDPKLISDLTTSMKVIVLFPLLICQSVTKEDCSTSYVDIVGTSSSYIFVLHTSPTSTMAYELS